MAIIVLVICSCVTSTAFSDLLFCRSAPAPPYGLEDFRATFCVRGSLLLADHRRVSYQFSRGAKGGSGLEKLVQQT